MEVDLRSLLEEQFGDMPVAIVGNLPYYITSPLIMRFLEEELPVESITVMVQKEAGQRLCAVPGSRECGAVSAAVWYYSEPKILFDVTRSIQTSAQGDIMRHQAGDTQGAISGCE